MSGRKQSKNLITMFATSKYYLYGCAFILLAFEMESILPKLKRMNKILSYFKESMILERINVCVIYVLLLLLILWEGLVSETMQPKARRQ